MIKSEKEYIRAMKNMILTIQREGRIDSSKANAEQLEVLADCIREGYIIGSLTDKQDELRTLDGTIHPQVWNNVIPLKGLAFLKPNKTDVRSWIAIVVSVFAALISLFAFLVTLLSNLDKIIENWSILFN